MTTVPKAKKEKALDTKEIISLAATKLIARHGYDGTSIRDIVEEAGVTKPVLYYYFKNKEALYNWMIRDAYEFFLEELKEIIESDLGYEDRMRAIIKIYFDCAHDYEDTIRLIFDAVYGTSRNFPKADIQHWEAQHLAMLTAFFQEGQALGLFRAMPPEQITLHFIGGVNAYLSMFIIMDRPIPDNADEIVLNLLNHGIGVK